MKKHIVDYFTNETDYPNFKAHNILPYGELWNYVASTFLNGFINYVTPIKIYQIDRYAIESEQVTAKYSDKTNSGLHQVFIGTKSELRKLIIKDTAIFYNTKIGMFHDDIVVLAKIETEKSNKIACYMLFWFDTDVSDCSIGRFQTLDSQEEIIQSLVNWLDYLKEGKKKYVEEGYDDGLINYTDLPLSFCQSWMSF